MRIARLGLVTVVVASGSAGCGGDDAAEAPVIASSAATGGAGTVASAGSGGSGGAVASTGSGGGGGESTGGGGAGGTTEAICTKKVSLHMANFSFVAPLLDAVGVQKNACWEYEARGAGFRCNYDGSEPDFVKTSGNGTYASYNEVKPLNQHDPAAVANCKQQSGGKPVRTYIVWNGSAWDNEGIAASVHFAEVYGTQADRDSKLPVWNAKGSSYKSVYRPMINLSPETTSSAEETYASVKKICKASTDGQWLGIYFYDPDNANGAGMADWKRMKIIEAMNDCTTE